ncbi:MAG: hypothetical protein FWB79_05385 [Treponema sp.]|nr:hypothetical protein [Treponema sp.]
MIECFNGDGEFSLLRLVPTVLRARDFRLYTRGKGKQRIVDLWQNGGAAILGHTPPSQLRELKNTAGRGLYAPFPHFLGDRCVKALSRVFPGRDIRLYAAPPPGLEDLVSTGNAGLWRPFLDPLDPLSVPPNAPPVLVPVVPGIQGWRVARTGQDAMPLGFCALAIDGPALEAARVSFPPGDFLPPVLLTVAARGIHDLIAAAPARANPGFPRIAVDVGRAWQRHGTYLIPRRPREDWSAMFRLFLEAGFLIPPVPFQPAILPAILSPGEEAKLAGLLASCA